MKGIKSRLIGRAHKLVNRLVELYCAADNRRIAQSQFAASKFNHREPAFGLWPASLFTK